MASKLMSFLHMKSQRQVTAERLAVQFSESTSRELVKVKEQRLQLDEALEELREAKARQRDG